MEAARHLRGGGCEARAGRFRLPGPRRDLLGGEGEELARVLRQLAVIADHEHPAVRREPPLDGPDLPARGAAELLVQHPLFHITSALFLRFVQHVFVEYNLLLDFTPGFSAANRRRSR